MLGEQLGIAANTMSDMDPQFVADPSIGQTGPSADDAAPKSKKKAKAKKKPKPELTEAEKGRLQPIASSILMTLLYAARMSRNDLLRPDPRPLDKPARGSDLLLYLPQYLAVRRA